ncbi:MAG: hypothetical protein RMK29_11045 [Myxococcales bacterium]|nr:hypothetical protein [Myxococcales bacterium]
MLLAAALGACAVQGEPRIQASMPAEPASPRLAPALPTAPMCEPVPPWAKAPPAPTEVPVLDLIDDAQLLLRVAACGPGPVPPDFDVAVVEAHCNEVRAALEAYRARWLALARPVLSQLVPPGLPERVVYPFGGGDLLTALATFPNATEITTLSLERAGDARAIRRLDAASLRQMLDLNRRNLLRMLQVNHSKTLNLGLTMRGELPGLLIFALVALVVHDKEPVSLRYFHLKPDGSLRYVTPHEVADAEDQATPLARAQARSRLFANVELRFRDRLGGPVVVYRHVSANLDDPHLAADPSVLRHLEAKGRVAAMTKAASYLLGFDEFSRIRRYLLDHMEWMISDSTGVPPRYATAAGFEQLTYGRYAGPFLPAGYESSLAFRRLWQSQPQRALAFRYGYPDRIGQHHLLITRRAALDVASTAGPAVARGSAAER